MKKFSLVTMLSKFLSALSIVFVLFAASAAFAHLELDLLTPDGDLYPGCEVEPESRPADCPYRLKIHGWDVYVSSLILADKLFANELAAEPGLEAIITYFNNLDWQFLLLDGSEDAGRNPVGRLLPKYFAPTLQDKGVSIYIFPLISPPGSQLINHPDDKYVRCGRAGFSCYLHNSKSRPGGQVQMAMFEPKEAFSTLVHELAHAWHDNVVPGGYDNQCIIDAYNFSVDRDQLYSNYLFRSEPFGFLDEVIEVGISSAYAATNHQEYFAELTTFYFLDDAFHRSSFKMPYSNRIEMHDWDWNGYWMVRILVERTGRNNPLWGVPPNNCDSVVTAFGEDEREISSRSFWPK